MNSIKIFISSPGDVARERHATAAMIQRSQGKENRSLLSASLP